MEGWFEEPLLLRSDKLRKADKLGEKLKDIVLKSPSTCAKFSRIQAVLPAKDEQ